MSKIALLDYGCGNIGSVAQAFEYLGHATHIVSAGNDSVLADVSHLVLPGVGAFEKAASGLRDRHLHEAISRHVEKGLPFLGICVGMQVLMQKGYEFGEHNGLGLFEGSARHLHEISPGFHCPHIGWDRVSFSPGSLFSDMNRDDLFFYFNHSYACHVTDTSFSSAECRSGQSLWPVVLERENVIGIQCHPEKSHLAGLSFLERFLKL